MPDSAQINIDTSTALNAVDSLVKKMDKLIRVSQAFDDALTKHIIKPVQQSADALNKVADSAKTVTAVFASVGSSINDAFKSLHSENESGISAIDNLRDMVKEFVEIGKLDKSGDFSKLSKSFDAMGRGLVALNKIGSDFNIDPNIAKKLADFVNQFKTVNEIVYGVAYAGGKSSSVDKNSDTAYIYKSAFGVFQQLSEGVSEVVKAFARLKNTANNIPAIKDITKIADRISRLVKSVGWIGAYIESEHTSNNGRVTKTKEYLLEDFTWFVNITGILSKFSLTITQLVKVSANVESAFSSLKDHLPNLIKDLSEIGKFEVKTDEKSGKSIKTYLDKHFIQFIELVNVLRKFASTIKSLQTSSKTISADVVPLYVSIDDLIRSFKDLGGFNLETNEETGKSVKIYLDKSFEGFVEVSKVLYKLGSALTMLHKSATTIESDIVSVYSSLDDLIRGLGGFGSFDVTEVKKKDGSVSKIKEFTNDAFAQFREVSNSLFRLSSAMSTIHRLSSSMDADIKTAKKSIGRLVNGVGLIGSALDGDGASLLSSTADDSKVSAVAQRFVKISKALADFGVGIKNINTVSNSVSSKALAASSAVRILINSFDKFIVGGKALKPEVIEALLTRFEKISKALADFGSGISAISNFKKAPFDMTAFSANIKGIIQTLAKLTLDSSFVQFERLANAMYKVSTASKNLVTATDKTQRAFKKLGEETKRTKTWIENMHPVVRQLFTAFAGYNVIYGFVRSVQHAVREMVDLEDRMARVNTIARGNKQQLAAWTQGVMNLSSAYGLAKNDLTQALYDINSATITGSKAFLVLEQASKAAVAGFTDVSKTSELLARIINAYGYSASDAGRLSDILFKTVERGINPMEELAQYMGRVLTVASNAGVSFEEVSAAIATMTSRGLQTNIAVTALNSAVLKLSQGSEKLNAVFQQYGYISSAAAVQTGGLVEAVRILQQVTGGSTEALTKLGFNYRDIRAMTVLASGAFSEFNHNLDEMNKAERATDDALKKRADTLQMKWNRLKETISNSLIAVQQWAGASEVFKGVIDAITSLVNTMVRIVTASSESLTVFESLVRTGLKLYVYVQVFKVLNSTIPAIVAKVKSLTAVIRTLSLNLHRSGKFFKALRKEAGAFGGTLKAIKASSLALQYFTTLKSTGVSTFRALRRTAKELGVSLQALRVKAVLFKNAVKGLKGLALAAVEIAAFEALEWALTKDIEKTEALGAVSVEAFDDAKKGVEGLSAAFAHLTFSDVMDKEAVTGVKSQLSEVESQIKTLESEIKAAETSGQKVQQASLDKLEELRNAYDYYKKGIDAVTKSREEYIRVNKEWLNIEGILNNIEQNRIAAYTKETSALSKYLTAMEKQQTLTKSLKGVGIDVSLLNISTEAFNENVKAQFDAGNISVEVRKNLLEFSNTFAEIAKSAKEATSEIKNMSNSLYDVLGRNSDFDKADRAVKAIERIRNSKIAKSDVQAPKFGDWLANSSVFENEMKEYRSGALKSFSGDMESIMSKMFIPFAIQYNAVKDYDKILEKRNETWDKFKELYPKVYPEESFGEMGSDRSIMKALSRPVEDLNTRPSSEFQMLSQYKRRVDDLNKQLEQMDGIKLRPFGSFIDKKDFEKLSKESQTALNNVKDNIKRTTSQDGMNKLLVDALMLEYNKTNLSSKLQEWTQAYYRDVQQLLLLGKDKEAEVKLYKLFAKAKDPAKAVKETLAQINRTITPMDKEFAKLTDRFKNGETLVDVMKNFTGTPEQRDLVIQYYKELIENTKELNKYLNDTKLISSQIKIDPSKTLKAAQEALKVAQRTRRSYGTERHTKISWYEQVEKMVQDNPWMNLKEAMENVLIDAGVDPKSDSWDDIRIRFKLDMEDVSKLKAMVSSIPKAFESLDKMVESMETSTLGKVEKYQYMLNAYNQAYAAFEKDGGMTAENLQKFQNAAQNLVNASSGLAAVKVPAEISATDAVRSGSSAAADILKKQLFAPTVKVNKDILNQVKTIVAHTKELKDKAVSVGLLPVVTPVN